MVLCHGTFHLSAETLFQIQSIFTSVIQVFHDEDSLTDLTKIIYKVQIP